MTRSFTAYFRRKRTRTSEPIQKQNRDRPSTEYEKLCAQYGKRASAGGEAAFQAKVRRYGLVQAIKRQIVAWGGRPVSGETKRRAEINAAAVREVAVAAANKEIRKSARHELNAPKVSRDKFRREGPDTTDILTSDDKVK